MAEYTIIWAGTPNFTDGRRGRTPIAIVDHITAGLYPGTLTWMQNPAAKASAHYLVLQDGRIFQLVKDEDTAWANGIVNQPTWALYDGTNPNRYTLSIEHENLGGGKLTEAQYQATLWLHRQLISRWKITVSRDTIIGHNQIDAINRPNDPGADFPWDQLFADLHKSAAPEAWKQIIIQQAQQKKIITQNHDPDATAVKWFALQVALNVLRLLGKQSTSAPAAGEWKTKVIQHALQEGLITQSHDPDQMALKWFILQVGLNVLKKSGIQLAVPPTGGDWKGNIVKQSLQAGLLNDSHDPDEVAGKWFVLAVALNAINKAGG